MINTSLIDKISKEIAGGVGGVDTKPFILGLLFLKSYSEKYWNRLLKESDDYLPVLNDLFSSDSEIGWLSESFDFENLVWGQTKEEQKIKRKRIISLINEIDLSDEHSLGDAYQYLIALFANNAGRYGGEYYSPKCVCELLTELVLVNAPNKINKIYDPTCGTASCLLTLFKKCKALGNNPEVCGQELNKTTRNMALGNVLLHKVKYDIALGDTLKNPGHLDKKFELIVANPPFSCNWEQLPEDIRFKDFALAPKSKSDIAFWLHSLHHLTDDGIIALVTFPGVLYRGGTEQKIRKQLIEKNLIDCVISLPENLFLNTSVAVSVVVLRKNKTTEDVLFIRASEFFTKKGKYCSMEQSHIEEIMQLYKDRKTNGFVSKLVDKKEIEEANWNLSPNTYIDEPDTREKYDSELERRNISTLTLFNTWKRIELYYMVCLHEDKMDEYNKLCNQIMDLADWCMHERFEGNYPFKDLLDETNPLDKKILESLEIDK